MISELLVGPGTLADGNVARQRGDKSGATVVTELHGKWYEQAARAGVFTVTQAAAGVLMTTAGTTAAFALANPSGSTKNLSIIRLEAVIKALPATPVIGFYAVYLNTAPQAAAVTGTALTPIAMPVGSQAVAVGKPFTTATLPVAPTLYRALQQKTATAEAPISPPPPFSLSFDGDLVLAPGTTLSIQQDAGDATNATMVCFAQWEEVAI